MSRQKAKPPIGGEPISGSKEDDGRKMNGDAKHPHCTTTSRRCLQPHEAALIKLDVVERRLHIANTTGDSDTWVRFYRSWLALHSLAFGYGKWAKGGSDGHA